MTDFQCFQPSLFAFLQELKANNDREWFNENKTRYEDQVRTPVLRFIEAFADHLPSLSPHFLAQAKKTGGSMMRPYRDTRFSKDKTPYKTNVGIQFRHVAGKDVHAPGYYVHLANGECFLGLGTWHPESKLLKAIRETIQDEPEKWAAVVEDAGFSAHWTLVGDSLKRPPRGFDKEHKYIEDIKRKDFIATITLEEAWFQEAGFVETLEERFRVGAPLMKFLCDAAGVPF